jgi:hypothetical protein
MTEEEESTTVNEEEEEDPLPDYDVDFASGCRRLVACVNLLLIRTQMMGFHAGYRRTYFFGDIKLGGHLISEYALKHDGCTFSPYT